MSGGANRSPFSAVVVGVLVAVSVFGFMAVLVLSAWSPELRDRNLAGAHPYSTSSIGYGGFVRLLEARGDPVSVTRFDRQLSEYTDALKVVTLTPVGMDSALEELELQGLALVVLPKWSGARDLSNPKWQDRVFDTSTDQVAGALSHFDANGEIWRVRAPAVFETDFGFFRPEFGDDLQLIRSNSLEPVIRTPGGILLGKLPGEDVFILSDPDLINTAGLSTLGRAEMALAMVDWLRYDDRASLIVFDATLHGFEQAQSVLQMVFDIPFLGATLIAVCVFLMFGWAGTVRFGAPQRQARAIALGKQALADSTAGLLIMAGREPRLAPGYLALTKRAAAKTFAAPKSLSDDDLARLFDRMSAENEPGYTQLADASANPATSREDLMIKARRLFNWRKEMTRGD